MKNANIMVKKSFFVTAVIAGNFIFGQIGINNSEPKATLDVTAKTTDDSKPEGIIAPRLTGEEIKGKDAKYLADQTGTIVYATSASPDAGVPAAKTINITAEGYYYFDGAIWQKFNSGTAAAGTEPWYDVATNAGATTNLQDIYQMGKVGVGFKTPRYNFEIGDNLNNGSYLSLSQSGANANGQSSLTYFTKRTGNESLTAATGNTSKGWKWMALSDAYQSGSGNPVLANSLFLQSYTNGAKVDNIMVANPNGNVGFGVQAPTTKVHIESANGVATGFRLVDGSEGAGKVLVSDVDGNASWALPASIPPLTINSTPGVWTSLDVVNSNGSNANMTYTGASAVVTIPGQYMISTRFISDKSPHGCSGILAFNLNKNSSTVFDRSTSAFSVQDPHMAPGTGGNDYIYTTQTAYLTAGTYYMFARTEGATGGACTFNNVRAGFAENSFTLTLLK